MNFTPISNVVKTLKKTELVFDNGIKLRIGNSNIQIEPRGTDEVIIIYPEIRDNHAYRVLYSSPTLDKHGSTTAEELVDYWESNDFFFDAVANQVLADGRAEFRADLPVTIGFPAVGAIYIVEKPTTILLGLYTTFQSGLYIKDTDTGSLNDWRRLNIKTKFLTSNFAIVDPNDQSKQFVFNVSDQSTGEIRAAKTLDRDGTISYLESVANFMGTGLRSVDYVQANAGDTTKLDIGEVEAYFVNNNIDIKNTIPFEKTFPERLAYTIQSPPPSPGDNKIVYISLDINGDVFETPLQLTPVQCINYVQLGFVILDDTGTIINWIYESVNFVINLATQFQGLKIKEGPSNNSGNVVTPNNNLTFNITSGVIFQTGANYFTNPDDPDRPTQQAESPAAFNRKLGIGEDLGVTTLINPNQWDDGTSTPAAMPVNDWSIKRISRFGNGGLLEVLLGQQTFDTKQEALQALQVYASNFTVPVDSALSVPLYWLVVQEGATDLTNINQAEFIPIATGNSGVTTVTGIVKTTLITEGFETGSFASNGWLLANDSTNQWHVGTATAYQGTQSAYISNDGGVSNAYTNNVVQVSHFYKSFTFPIDAEDIYLGFRWKNIGEAGLDQLTVRLLDVAPVAGAIPSGIILLDAFGISELHSSSDWVFFKVEIAPQVLAGLSKFICFTWENDMSLGDTPAAIDMITVGYKN